MFMLQCSYFFFNKLRSLCSFKIHIVFDDQFRVKSFCFFSSTLETCIGFISTDKFFLNCFRSDSSTLWKQQYSKALWFCVNAFY